MIKQIELKWTQKDLAKHLSTKTHQRYIVSSGQRAPGVTTVGGMLDKSGPLMHWAWNLGIEGIDYRKKRDKEANVGTVAHEMTKIHCIGGLLKKKDSDIAKMIKVLCHEYAPDVVGRSENSFIAYLDFEKEHKVKPKMVEVQITNDKFFFGGTLDLYGEVDGSMDLVDFKTGQRVYDSHVIQVSAYRKLLLEEGVRVDRTWVLILNKDTGEFKPFLIPEADLKDGWKIFAGLLFGYPAYKGLKSKYSKTW